jgi:ribonuclease P protein component
MKPRVSSRGRLSRSAEFERVYRQGRSTANRHLVLYAFPNATSERPRLGLSVSRKVGGAVERNRVKRLLREALARHEQDLRAGQDLVVVARPSAAELVERDGLQGIDEALSELIAKAGIREGSEASAETTPAAEQAEQPVGHEQLAAELPGTGQPDGTEQPEDEGRAG